MKNNFRVLLWHSTCHDDTGGVNYFVLLKGVDLNCPAGCPGGLELVGVAWERLGNTWERFFYQVNFGVSFFQNFIHMSFLASPILHIFCPHSIRKQKLRGSQWDAPSEVKRFIACSFVFSPGGSGHEGFLFLWLLCLSKPQIEKIKAFAQEGDFGLFGGKQQGRLIFTICAATK